MEEDRWVEKGEDDSWVERGEFEHHYQCERVLGKKISELKIYDT